MKYRFIKEYKNYIVNRVKESMLSEQQKQAFIFACEKTTKNVFKGMITLNECMTELARIERKFNNYDIFGSTFY